MGQVFATKTDLLPRQYIEALKFVFEECPATSFKKVEKLLRMQLGISISTTFVNFNYCPIASATIAQVHTGVLKGSNDQVAIKVQHSGSENLLRSDIRNMLMISKIMDRIGLKPPIDHTSVLIEYTQQVLSISIVLCLLITPLYSRFQRSLTLREKVICLIQLDRIYLK